MQRYAGVYEEHELEDADQDRERDSDRRDFFACDLGTRYPVLEAAAKRQLLHLRLKVGHDCTFIPLLSHCYYTNYNTLTPLFHCYSTDHGSEWQGNHALKPVFVEAVSVQGSR